ncbi:MAG: cobalamin-binding protein [Geodermatophilaceae bacterium]|nr:cobalamin-binding protein [Geodermatophilaceae bacterium]
MGTSYDGSPARVVSLVPSLTESIVATAPELLVGATDWCTYPADLAVPRVGGTKFPDLAAVVGLRPDLVVANAEENRAEDIAAMRAAGVAVWVTAPATVPMALDSLQRLLGALGYGEPPWLREARDVWAAPAPVGRRTAVVPIWRRPWMVLGRHTFAGDLLARLGIDNLFRDDPERYPKRPIEQLRGADLVVLPDEPYAFTAADGPEAFPGIPCALVSGRHLTWYGPSLVEARSVLAAQLETRR